jgi:hypothetical protein
VRLQSKERTDRDLEPVEDITKELCSNLDSLVGTATGYRLAVQGYIRGSRRLFSTPHCPDQLWGPPNLLSNEHRAFFFRQSGRGVKLTRPFTSILRSRMVGLCLNSLCLSMACCLTVYLIKLRDITVIFYQGPQIRSERCGREINQLLFQGTEPRVLCHPGRTLVSIPTELSCLFS